MKRATKNPSKVFSSVLKQAQERLLIDANGADNLAHRGLKGNHRAQALAEILANHLPRDFSVLSGEIIDYLDQRSGEIDLCIVDRSSCAPVQQLGESALIPAEAVYAVIEVKSVLSKEELAKCFSAAKKVRNLRPFKRKFITPPLLGKNEQHHYRCPYFVFGYTSNLSIEDWARKEMERVDEVARHCKVSTDLIDRIFLIDRGIVRPQVRHALVPDDPSGIFLEFYIHLMNFITREKKRRPDIDWMNYASRSKWTKIV